MRDGGQQLPDRLIHNATILTVNDSSQVIDNGGLSVENDRIVKIRVARPTLRSATLYLPRGNAR